MCPQDRLGIIRFGRNEDGADSWDKVIETVAAKAMMMVTVMSATRAPPVGSRNGWRIVDPEQEIASAAALHERGRAHLRAPSTSAPQPRGFHRGIGSDYGCREDDGAGDC